MGEGERQLCQNCLPFLLKISLKRKNVLPKISFRVDPFFGRDLVSRKAKMKSQKLSFLSKMAEILANVPSLLHRLLLIWNYDDIICKRFFYPVIFVLNHGFIVDMVMALSVVNLYN